MHKGVLIIPQNASVTYYQFIIQNFFKRIVNIFLSFLLTKIIFIINLHILSTIHLYRLQSLWNNSLTEIVSRTSKKKMIPMFEYFPKLIFNLFNWSSDIISIFSTRMSESIEFIQNIICIIMYSQTIVFIYFICISFIFFSDILFMTDGKRFRNPISSIRTQHFSPIFF